MLRLALSLSLALVLALFMACGGDDDAPADGDNDSTNPSIGPGAQFPMHITNVTPEHGAAVTNAELPIGDAEAVSGICVGFDFREGAGMGDDPTSLVSMFMNNEDVSGSLNWVVTDDIPTSSGNGCYAPGEPLIPDVHNVRVRYSDSTGREFEYPWQFEITE